MPSWVMSILQLIVLSIILLVIYHFLRIYFLPKIKFNKWVVIALMIFLFIFPAFFGKIQNKILLQAISYTCTGLVVILFLWFLDSMGWGSRRFNNKNSKKIIIKPKAKPNRVKNKKNSL